MQFDTKIAVVLRDDLAGWQKTNVTAFLVSGIGATVPGVVGEPYRDASENEHLPMFVQPVLVYEADADGLRRAYERAMTRASRLRSTRASSSPPTTTRRTELPSQLSQLASSISWESPFAPSERPSTRWSTGCASIRRSAVAGNDVWLAVLWTPAIVAVFAPFPRGGISGSSHGEQAELNQRRGRFATARFGLPVHAGLLLT